MTLAQENLRGAMLMVFAMACFAVEDMFIKRAAQSLPVGQILILFGLAGMIAFSAIAAMRGQRPWHGAMLGRTLLLKAVLEVVGRLGYTLGIALTPLSNASAILQATPLVVVAGAAVLFGEKVGLRRWLAVGIGFMGVLIVLRPGMEGFVPAALWTVIGMFGFAGRDLASRAAPKVLSNPQLGAHGFAALTVAGLILLPFTGAPVRPSPPVIGFLAAASLFGVTAYWSLTAAMRMGEVSVVTPFRYTRLLFGIALGIAVFGESFDRITLAGAVLILASGLYTLLRRPRREPFAAM
ncbi:MAG: DMT family transporter [Zhengella sp.]|uniref:DMT family transporter n=1 Tax=Zhengella sp. TaxID=2282762 RepID=UPI0035274B8D|nr:DMT family transporter [Brucellaceae bacterium]